jgi:RNA polymerase sigma factor (sigma-70 family)
MPLPEDADPLALLATLALAGDRAALEQLCRQLQGPMFRLALRVLGDASEASDATQEVLLKVVTHLSQFRGESRLLTWAYTVATRHLLRHRRTLARERSVVALEGAIRGGLSITEPASAPDGDARVQTAETRLACTGATLACLSVDERVAVVLAEVLGADDDLGARLCEVAPTVYRKRLSRARQKLRPVLEELCGLARAEAPCSCTRQARAKQIAGIAEPPRFRLPLADAAKVQRAADALGQVRRLGAVFAFEPMVDPPEALWARLHGQLDALLVPREPGTPGAS